MKKTNKFFSVVLALVLVLAMSVPAFAAGTGAITITNAVKDHTYSVYKMLDFVPVAEDSELGTYEIAEGWEDFFKGATAQSYFTVVDSQVSKKAEEVDADLAKAAIEYAKANTAKVSPVAQKIAEGDTVEFTNLDLGYYAVDTTLGAVCSLTNTDSDFTLIEKNSAPELVKKIVEGSALVDANSAAIGDTVTYQSTIKVGTGAEKYVMHDKMSDGLTFETVKSVKVGEADVAAANYTVKTSDLEDAACDFEIIFTDEYLATLAADTKIVVTYTAKLNSSAVIGEEGNPNTAWLEYGEKYDSDSDGDVDDKDDKPSTPEDNVITYTANLTVDKVDGDNKALKGAAFTLYKGDELIGEVKGEDLTTFVWTGLDEGTYTLKETATPVGYNTIEDIVFTITCNEPETVNTVADKATWTSDNDDIDFADGTFKTTVVNTTGLVLPETGGIGTTIFYIVGGLLVLGAAVLLITKKRVSAEV